MPEIWEVAVSVEVDASELREFAADVRHLPAVLSRHLVPTVKRGAARVKESMKRDLEQSGNAGFRYVSRTVGFDVSGSTVGDVVAEVGPSKPDGALANVAYFGTYKGGGTVRDPWEALGEEAEKFEKALAEEVAKLWG